MRKSSRRVTAEDRALKLWERMKPAVKAGLQFPKYPYVYWCDGAQHTIERGRDFFCSVPSIRRMLCNYAISRGLVVHTRREGDQVHILAVGKRDVLTDVELEPQQVQEALEDHYESS